MTITLTSEEAQQVHDALLNFENDISDAMFAALTTLRARLAQPEPEPVAWIKKDRSSIEVSIMSAEYMRNEGFEPLYTAPSQREWQGLTHEEKMEILTRSITAPSRIEVAEALLKEKNSG